MPFSKYFGGKGEKVMKSMKSKYGKEKGERVFYATSNKHKGKNKKKGGIGPSGNKERIMNMDLIILVLVLALIGFIVWIITTRIPMPAGWAMAIQLLAFLVIILYVLSRFANLPNVLPR